MDNRQILLTQAMCLFSERGYDAVGVQEIVEASGVTKPTLYHYFGSKHGLLQELLRGYFSELEKQLTEAGKYAGDLPLTLQKVTEVYFQFAKENPVFYRLQLGLWFAPPESEAYLVVAKLNRFQYDLLEDVFLQAANQHGNMRGRHKTYALTLLGMINNYIGLALNGQAALNIELVQKAVHQFQHGIYS
jgi:AcrR family transcriptional regulator